MEKKLNKEQLQAVNHGEGPLLIIAGAGTGKTTVITERVKHLVLDGLCSANEILALTFTEKAATEMEGRIDEVLPYGYTQMWVMTFHGFCDRILKQDGFHIGIDTNYKLMTTAESLDLLKRNLYSLGLDYFAPLGNPTKFLYGLLSHFSRLQDENISSKEYVEWAKKNYSQFENSGIEEKLEAKKWLELSLAFEKYEELKNANSLYDFGDLIVKTILLFEKRPNVLANYQKQFKYILVDEFQDTNYAQNQLVTMLAKAHKNITVVGDDDQSIYRFRGAAVSNMLQFKAHFPETKIVTLIQNYRSKQNILDAAHALISNNNPDRLEVLEKIDKKLVSTKEGQGEIEFCNTNSSYDEADYVLKKILELKKEKKLNYSDFAILVRANNHADGFVRAFEVEGVPYQFLGPGKLFLEPEIVDLVSYLQIITDIHNDSAMYKVLSMEVFGISPILLAKLSSQARRENKFLFDVLNNLGDEIDEEDRTKISAVMEIILLHLGKVKNEPANAILLDFLKLSGLTERLVSSDTSEGLKVAQNIEKFFSKIKSFEATIKLGSSVFDVVNWLKLQSEIGESPQASEIDWMDEDKVNILTVHSAKGLEFPVVFMVNLVSQRFPSMERKEQIPIPMELVREVLPSGDFHLQEERRLFYVGVTRAKEFLYMTGAKFYGEAKREKKVSLFVPETLVEVKSSKYIASKNLHVSNDVAPKNETINKEKLILKTISYSQIETFKICPLHYKLSYILHIPVEVSPAQSFGVSFHSALKSFSEKVKSGEKPTKQVLDEILKEEWKREGYLSPLHLDNAYEKALGFLEYYFENWFEVKNNTVAIEQPFSFKLHDVFVKGKIDRIDETKEGIHIIDYKTGSKAFTQKEADQSLQLSIYALAATKIKEEPFGRKPDEIKLSLIYFDSPQIVTTYRNTKQLKEAENEILEWKRQIEESDFSCSGNFLCQNCEYKAFCKNITEN